MKKKMKDLTLTFPFFLLFLLMISVSADLRAEEKDYDNWKKMDVPPAPALNAEQQMKTFRVAPGFELQLAAAEPQVVDPVVVRWDASGRMWVVEMRGYMPNVEGKGEDKPVGKIAILQDKDNDGYYEDRTVFLDELVQPRAIALVKGGVLVAEPPHLWYCRDTDGDLVADTKTEVLGGYAKSGNVEHRENGLRQAIDNWMYNAKSNRRFLFTLDEGKPLIRVDNTRFRGQWGISQDSFGRLYYNTNSNYLRTEHFPENLKQHNFKLRDSMTSSHSVASDQLVFPIRINPGVNRGYRPNTLRDDGRLKTTTGVSGQTVYRGDQFSDSFRENVFVPDVTGNTMAYFEMVRNGSDITAKHQTYEDEEWGKRDFLASKDERFRPVDVENGPDGTIYVVDFYRGIIQHKTYMTDKYLKKQVIARNLDEPVGLGRVWRIVAKDEPRRKNTGSLRKKSSGELVDLLSHPNGWHRDWAQRLLIRRADADVVPELRALARGGTHPIGRIHAIWTLEGLRKLDEETIQKALKDDHKQVRKAIARARVNREMFAPPAFKELDKGIFEAEKAQKLMGPTTDSDHDGYQGDGFINFTRKKGGSATMTVSGVPAGKYRLSIRYALDRNESRPLALEVNGTTVKEKLSFPSTGGWTTWKTVRVPVTLKQGTNKITLRTIGNEGPNVDYVRIEQRSTK